MVLKKSIRYARRLIRPLSDVSQENLLALHNSLKKEAAPSHNYLVLIVSSCLIATFGLINDSAAVIIGAMVIAPLMLPLRAVAFAALEGDFLLFRKGFVSVFVGTAIAVFLSAMVGLLVGIPEFGSEVLSRTQPTLVDLGIAVAAGGVSGFAKLRPEINDAVAGTAIAVALMPPICVVGLSLSQGSWTFGSGAFLLYLTNLLGIVLACMLVFILSGYTKASHALGVTLGLTAILLLPLGVSFFNLVRQAQLQATLRRNLVNRTITIGQQVQLVRTEVNWTTNPPEAHLRILTEKPITPRQVRLVEEFIAREMGRPFTLVIQVSRVEYVRGSDETPTETNP
ncbi:MAG: DUF389 domain-containing protein [Desertifilum sp.]|nr:DUF389 domain-containing protein [Oscillatoria laete-virens]MCD8485942.1 DUF389 domain-containing protein [Desertifilum sp.]MDI9639151.1 DUF389 domain-containing protein [Geitlerinema splendidum]MDL5052923.1 DUF389 domain-containing protein [Oscillatoria laete-virens NRMC-F 0139]